MFQSPLFSHRRKAKKEKTRTHEVQAVCLLFSTSCMTVYCSMMVNKRDRPSKRRRPIGIMRPALLVFCGVSSLVFCLVLMVLTTKTTLLNQEQQPVRGLAAALLAHQHRKLTLEQERGLTRNTSARNQRPAPNQQEGHASRFVHHQEQELKSSDQALSFDRDEFLLKKPSLPAWMTQYFAWHNESLLRLNEDHSLWKDYRYLVLRCLQMDHKCGGASDRLQSIPMVLGIAAKHERLLFIEWEKPAPLTAFLVPVEIDWNIPTWFQKTTNVHDKAIQANEPHMIFQRSPAILSDKHMYRLDEHNTTTMVDMRYQTTDHGCSYYNKHIEDGAEPDFDTVYPLVWASLFRPAPAVQEIIDQTKIKLGLQEKYNSLHVRSMFYKDKSQKNSRVEYAVDCAFQKLQLPLTSKENEAERLFVASDSALVAETAVRYGTHRLGRTVAASQSAKSSSDAPLHLDRGSNFLASPETADWMDFPASAYYDIFVDLYLLSGGQCVVYNNVGGYGRWASRIANHSCAINLQGAQCHDRSAAAATTKAI